MLAAIEERESRSSGHEQKQKKKKKKKNIEKNGEDDEEEEDDDDGGDDEQGGRCEEDFVKADKIENQQFLKNISPTGYIGTSKPKQQWSFLKFQSKPKRYFLDDDLLPILHHKLSSTLT